MTGTVGILNVGAGDVELRFDSSNISERIRAGRIVKDMLRRGYALLVEVERDGEKRFERAIDFDESKSCYIIADFDPVVANQADTAEKEITDGESVAIEGETHPESAGPGRRRGGRPKREIDAVATRAVAVGRSAGG